MRVSLALLSLIDTGPASRSVGPDVATADEANDTVGRRRHSLITGAYSGVTTRSHTSGDTVELAVAGANTRQQACVTRM